MADCQPGTGSNPPLLHCFCCASCLSLSSLSLSRSGSLCVSVFPDRLLSVGLPSPLITTLLILALSHRRHSFSVLDFLNRQSENFAIETGENRRKEEEKEEEL